MSKKILLWLSPVVIAGVIAVILLSGRSASGSGKYGVSMDPAKYDLVNVADLLSKPDSFAEKTVIIQGQAGQVCQSSGCWLILTDGSSQLFVQFYDFTVRMSPGTQIRVQGRLRIQNGVPYLIGQGLEVVR